MLSKKKKTLKNWISVNFDLDRKHLSFCHNSRLWCEHLFRPCVTPGWQKGGWAAGDAPPEEIIKVSFVSLLLRCIPEAPAGGRPRDPHSWVPTRNHIHEHTHTHTHTHTLYLSSSLSFNARQTHTYTLSFNVKSAEEASSVSSSVTHTHKIKTKSSTHQAVVSAISLTTDVMRVVM